MVNPSSKLVYLEVGGFGKFKDFSLNLSNELTFEVKANQTMSIRRSKDYFGKVLGDNISSMNIIAGENGVGKTTLLKTIAELLADREDYQRGFGYDYLMIFQIDRETLYIKTPERDSGPYVFDTGTNDTFSIRYGQDGVDFGRSIIYYSPYLDFNTMDIYGSKEGFPIVDLSSTQILIDDLEEKIQEDTEDIEFEENPLVRHRVNNVKRQLKLFNETRGAFEFPFPLPKELSVSFHRLTFDRDDVSISDRGIFDNLQGICSEFFRGYPENRLSKVKMAKIMFLRNLLGLFFISVNDDKSQSILHHRFAGDILDRISNGPNTNADQVIDLLLYFFKAQDIFPSELFQRLIDDTFEKIRPNNIVFSNSNHHVTILIETTDQVIGNYFALLETKVNSKSPNRYIIPHISKFISFDWQNFSSGEKMFIDLFSRIYGIKARLRGIKQPILLLIDEGEMGLHPKWQIRFISTLRTFINEILLEFDVEVILATHSPLVLSDFPNQRVHLFKKDKKGKTSKAASLGTLAQNTSKLLANEFFIETTLIGNLAKEYVNDIITDIRSLKKGKVMPKDVIGIGERIKLIDEPLIRNLLMDELDRTANA